MADHKTPRQLRLDQWNLARERQYSQPVTKRTRKTASSEVSPSAGRTKPNPTRPRRNTRRANPPTAQETTPPPADDQPNEPAGGDVASPAYRSRATASASVSERNSPHGSLGSPSGSPAPPSAPSGSRLAPRNTSPPIRAPSINRLEIASPGPVIYTEQSVRDMSSSPSISSSSSGSSVSLGPETAWFHRVTLASASINVPRLFQRTLGTKQYLLEYKRLAPRSANMPFDIYTLQLCGVNNTDVALSVREFVPPYAALHCATRINRTTQFVHEGYRSLPDREYDPPNILDHDECISDAKLLDDAIYDISEFSFHLSKDKCAWMDLLFPVAYLLYHILLTYVRYLATMSGFIPFLSSASFIERMTLRMVSGLFFTYVYSSSAIFTQSVCGAILQCALYRRTAASPEIRGSLQVAPFSIWLLIDGVFCLLAWAVERYFPGYSQRYPWLSKCSFHTFWDMIGLGLNPVAIGLKFVMAYFAYSSLVQELGSIVAEG